MDPQKTPPSSPDSEKSTEDVTGSTGNHHMSEDPKPWGSNPSGDSASSSTPGDSVTKPDDNADNASDAAAESSAPADDDKAVASSDSTDGDKPAEDTPKPEAPISSPEPGNTDIPGAIPPPPAPAATTPPAPVWPATSDAPNVVMPASAVGGAHKMANKKGLLMALVIVVVLLVLGGGAAAAYFGYVVPSKPENVLKTALMNTFAGDKIQSEHFDGKVSVKDKTSGMTIAATFNGGSKSDGAFQVKADVDAVVTKVNLDVRSVDGSTYYLKVGGLEGLPELLKAYGDTQASAYAPVIAGLNNKWIEINESILSSIGADAGTLKLSQADRTKIADAYAAHQFLSVQEKLKNEKISGMDSYHYKVVVNKTELKGFMVALKDAKLQGIKVTQDDITSFNDSVKNVDFSKFPIELWVTKDTKLIDQVTFTYSDNSATLNVRYTTLDFNKPVTVTKPTGAKSLLEVISDFYLGQSGNSALMQQLQSNGISL